MSNMKMTPKMKTTLKKEDDLKTKKTLKTHNLKKDGFKNEDNLTTYCKEMKPTQNVRQISDQK